MCTRIRATGTVGAIRKALGKGRQYKLDFASEWVSCVLQIHLLALRTCIKYGRAS